MRRLLLWIAVLATAACAADITGTWKGTADSPVGPVERTFVFKVEGTKLTGETTSSLTGKSTIEDGNINGDRISFRIAAEAQGYELKLQYTGVVKGDEIKLHVESEDGNVSLDYTIKRAR